MTLRGTRAGRHISGMSVYNVPLASLVRDSDPPSISPKVLAVGEYAKKDRWCQCVNMSTLVRLVRPVGLGSVQVKETEVTGNLNDDSHDLRLPFAGPTLERNNNNLDPRYCSSDNRDSTGVKSQRYPGLT
jgi:hypothetical protein